MSINQTIGFDYSLTHGSVVLGDFTNQESPNFIEMFTYKKKDSYYTLGYKTATYESAVYHASHISDLLYDCVSKYRQSINDPEFDLPIGMDFSWGIVYYPTNNLQSMVTSYCAGIINSRSRCHIIQPPEVRKLIELKRNEKKEKVIAAYERFLPLPDTSNDDVKDAAILSYVLWRKLNAVNE